MSAQKINDGIDRASRDYKVGYSSGYQAGLKERPIKDIEAEIVQLKKRLEARYARETELEQQLANSGGAREKSYAKRAERAEGMFEDLLDTIWRGLPCHMRDQLIVVYPNHIVASILRLEKLDELNLYNDKGGKA